MAKTMITPEQVAWGYTVSRKWVGSVSGGCKTMHEACDRIRRDFNTEYEEGYEIVSAELVWRKWDAWYEGEPAPKPEEKLLWSYKKNDAGEK